MSIYSSILILIQNIKTFCFGEVNAHDMNIINIYPWMSALTHG